MDVDFGIEIVDRDGSLFISMVDLPSSGDSNVAGANRAVRDGAGNLPGKARGSTLVAIRLTAGSFTSRGSGCLAAVLTAIG